MTRLLLTASLLTLFAAPAFAKDFNVSGMGQVVSDYNNRGISRSDENPALQGRIQLEHITGVYAGAGASTIDMKGDGGANVEGLLFGGYKGNFDGLEYDGKLSYTGYPSTDNDDLDYIELAFTGGYNFDVFYASLSWAFSPDYINGSGASFYYGGDIIVPIQTAWSAKAHMGFQFVTDEKTYVSSDYADWSLGLWYNWADYDVDFGLQYVDTDLDDNECVEKCGSRALVSISKDFNW